VASDSFGGRHGAVGTYGVQVSVRPPFRQALRRGLSLHCPHCGKGRLFRGWLNQVLPRCPHCGLSYFRESGYYLGGMILTYVSVVLVLVAVYLVSFLLPGMQLRGISDNEKFVLWIGFTVVLAFLFVRPAYSLWLALDFWVDPWEPDPKV
jgi:uncharacterized protein (DUF983 family)